MLANASKRSARRFEDLVVWQKARALAGLVYKVSSTGPFAKDYALRQQIRRAAISTMSNIAEGFERGGDREFGQFLSAAKGSCGEVRSQLRLAQDLGYVDETTFSLTEGVALETSSLLAGFMKYLLNSSFKGSKFRQHTNP